MLPFNASESGEAAFRETDSAFGEWAGEAAGPAALDRASESTDSESYATTSTGFGQYWGSLLGEPVAQGLPQGLPKGLPGPGPPGGRDDDALTLYNVRLIETGMYERLRRALATKHRRQPWLASLVARAVSELGKRDVSAVLADIRDVVAEMSEDESGAKKRAVASETPTSTESSMAGDVCERIPAHERGKYPYCAASENELTRDILELVRLLSSSADSTSIAAALRKRGYSPHELRSAATRFVEGSTHLFKTNRLFGKGGGEAGKVFEAVMELVQNRDFVQHMVQLMAMHLPPDYPWSSEQILHVSKWWIMHYISLVRPHLVHAVIECPDSDVRKCHLAGLSLGGSSVPVALWRGSSLTVLDDETESESRGTYFTSLYRENRKWGQACSLFKSLFDELKASRPGEGRFGKLTPEHRRKLRTAGETAEKTWREGVADFKTEVYVAGTWEDCVTKLLEADVSTGAVADTALFPLATNENRYKYRRIKHLLVHGTRSFYASDGTDNVHKHAVVAPDAWTEAGATPANAHKRAAYEAAKGGAIKNAQNTIRANKLFPVKDTLLLASGNTVAAPVGVASLLASAPGPGFAGKPERAEASASFKLGLNTRLLMTPQYIADLVSEVREESGKPLTDYDLWFGGFFRYGLALARYSEFPQTKSELTTHYGLGENISKVFAFHENAKRLVASVPALARSPRVLLGEFDAAGAAATAAGPSWVKSESERHATAAALTALLHIGLGSARAKNGLAGDPLKQYLESAASWFEMAREYGVDNLAESSLVTETRTAPDVRTFYDESTDSDLYAETRDGGDSLSAVDQATDDWMKRLERVFEDTDETY